jgi:TRAP-type C4-dicarboxylate transport system permease small subunit
MRLIDLICNFLAILAGLMLVGTMLGIVLMVFLREVAIGGGSHIFSFTEWGLFWIVMAASPWLVREKGHVFIELLTAAVPQPYGRVVSRVVSALCILICLFLVWYTWGAAAKAYRLGDADMRSVDMPRWLLIGAMPICFGLMAAQFARFVFGRDTLHSGQAGVHE